MSKTLTCPVCNNTEHAVIKKYGTSCWYLCKTCSFLHCHPLSKELFTKIASKYNTKWGFAGSNNNLEYEKTYKAKVQNQKKAWKLFTSKINIMPSSKVLDFGSADGTMLEFFSQININAVGLEPSGPNASFSKSKGHTVINGYLEEDTFPSNAFDVIYIQDSLQLLPSIGKTFQIFHNILHEKGIIMCREKQYHFSGLRPWKAISHCYPCYLSKTSMSNILSIYGFKVEYYRNRLGDFMLIAKKVHSPLPITGSYLKEKVILSVLPFSDPILSCFRQLAIFFAKRIKPFLKNN